MLNKGADEYNTQDIPNNQSSWLFDNAAVYDMPNYQNAAVYDIPNYQSSRLFDNPAVYDIPNYRSSRLFVRQRSTLFRRVAIKTVPIK